MRGKQQNGVPVTGYLSLALFSVGLMRVDGSFSASFCKVIIIP